MFTENELAFMRSQRLLRLATLEPNGQPDVDAVGFEFDGQRFIIGGRNLPASRKYKNVAAGHHLVSLILDDLVTVSPWQPRGVKIHGVAQTAQMTGRFGPGDYLVVTPQVSWSWGIEGDQFQSGRTGPHKTVWTPPSSRAEDKPASD